LVAAAAAAAVLVLALILLGLLEVVAVEVVMTTQPILVVLEQAVKVTVVVQDVVSLV
jgi:hypothetical protein